MGKKIDYIFLLPGNPSSNLQSINVNLAMNNLLFSGKRVGYLTTRSCNIYVARNGCLSRKRGFRVDQKPFEGVFDDYDRMIWVDSDNIVTTNDILKLIAHDVDIVSAWYRQYSTGNLDDTNKVACGYWKRGDGYQEVRSLTVADIPKQPVNEKGLIEVDYAGMGLMIVKKGVFESMSYPWFRGDVIHWVENGVEMADVDTDDAGFCARAKENGFKVYVDPAVRIKHEKLVGV